MIGRDHKIRRIGEAGDIGRKVTAGFYRFEPSVFDFADQARARGLSALRQLLGFLLESGYGLYGVSVAKTIDIDRPEDVIEAETYLKHHGDGSYDCARHLPGENIFSRQG